MKITPVTGSSMIAGHAYDPETQTMKVKMRNGATYEHPDIPPQTYAAFSGAASPGQFYNKRIKPVHVAVKLK